MPSNARHGKQFAMSETTSGITLLEISDAEHHVREWIPAIPQGMEYHQSVKSLERRASLLCDLIASNKATDIQVAEYWCSVFILRTVDGVIRQESRE